MKINKVQQAKTAQEARNYAIEWQNWQSDQMLSLGELSEWQVVFVELAEKFNLKEEFNENGII